MNQTQIAQLLTNPELTPARRAALEAKIAPPKPSASAPTPGYDPANDPLWEEFSNKYESEKGNYRYGGESPLPTILAHPIGRLWHYCHVIRVLGGPPSTEASAYVTGLLPVLRHTEDADVRQTVCRALRSLHRFSAEEIPPALRDELAEALQPSSPDNDTINRA